FDEKVGGNRLPQADAGDGHGVLQQVAPEGKRRRIVIKMPDKMQNTPAPVRKLDGEHADKSGISRIAQWIIKTEFVTARQNMHHIRPQYLYHLAAFVELPDATLHWHAGKQRLVERNDHGVDERAAALAAVPGYVTGKCLLDKTMKRPVSR